MRGLAGAGMAFTAFLSVSLQAKRSNLAPTCSTRLLRRCAPRNDGVRLPSERVVDHRLLLGRQRIVEGFERRAGLLHRLQPRLEELLAPAHAVEDRPLSLRARFRRQLVAELAFLRSGRASCRER